MMVRQKGQSVSFQLKTQKTAVFNQKEDTQSQNILQNLPELK